eukprot:SAG11_NODE_2525_length_3255_cov_1.657795_5_plen_70_part_00
MRVASAEANLFGGQWLTSMALVDIVAPPGWSMFNTGMKGRGARTVPACVDQRRNASQAPQPLTQRSERT